MWLGQRWARPWKESDGSRWRASTPGFEAPGRSLDFVFSEMRNQPERALSRQRTWSDFPSHTILLGSCMERRLPGARAEAG